MRRQGPQPFHQVPRCIQGKQLFPADAATMKWWFGSLGSRSHFGLIGMTWQSYLRAPIPPIRQPARTSPSRRTATGLSSPCRCGMSPKGDDRAITLESQQPSSRNAEIAPHISASRSQRSLCGLFDVAGPCGKGRPAGADRC